MGLLDENMCIKTGEKLSLFDEDKLSSPFLKNSYYIPDLKLEPDKEVMKAIYENVEHVRKSQEAQVSTAQNTEIMIGQIDQVICNQNNHIKMLIEQNQYIRQMLGNIFGSSEDSTIVQKEILKMIKEQDVNDNLLKEKSIDVIIQMLFTCLNIYLSKYGLIK